MLSREKKSAARRLPQNDSLGRIQLFLCFSVSLLLCFSAALRANAFAGASITWDAS
jgi:hypothetical protein